MNEIGSSILSEITTKNNTDLNVVFEGNHLFPGYSRGIGKIWNLNKKPWKYYFKFSI